MQLQPTAVTPWTDQLPAGAFVKVSLQSNETSNRIQSIPHIKQLHITSSRPAQSTVYRVQDFLLRFVAAVAQQ